VTDAADVLLTAAQQAGEARLSEVMHRFHAEQDGDDDAWDGFAATDPFCGCETCCVREVLTAAWPLIRAAALDDARRQLAAGA
jgi:hypothetical protein